MHIITTFITAWIVTYVLCKPIYNFLRRKFPLAFQEHESAFFSPLCLALFGTYLLPTVSLIFLVLFGSIPLTIWVMIGIYIVDLVVLFICLKHFNEIERRNGTVYKKTVSDLIDEAKREYKESKRAGK